MSDYFSRRSTGSDGLKDVDAEPSSPHHTLGKSYNQAAPGNHKHGQTQEVIASVDTVVAAAGGEIDLTGMSISLTVPSADSIYLILGIFDTQLNVAGVFLGRLHVDGVLQFGEALMLLATLTERVTVSQFWTLRGLTPGSHVIKLRGASSGTHTIKLGNTRLLAIRLTD